MVKEQKLRESLSPSIPKNIQETLSDKRQVPPEERLSPTKPPKKVVVETVLEDSPSQKEDISPLEESRKLLGTTFESQANKPDYEVAGTTEQDQEETFTSPLNKPSKKGRQRSSKPSQKNQKDQTSSSDYATKLKSPPPKKLQLLPRLEPLRPSYQAYRKEQEQSMQSSQQCSCSCSVVPATL